MNAALLCNLVHSLFTRPNGFLSIPSDLFPISVSERAGEIEIGRQRRSSLELSSLGLIRCEM